METTTASGSTGRFLMIYGPTRLAREWHGATRLAREWHGATPPMLRPADPTDFSCLRSYHLLADEGS